MTREQLEEIRQATETLPERFRSHNFYHATTDLFCWWGWVAKQLGHDPRLYYMRTWDFLKERFGVDVPECIEADHIIDSCTGQPECVREHMLWLLEKKIENKEQQNG